MLVTYPDPILNKKTALVENVNDPEIKSLISEMLFELEKNNGLGIAAPQVGKSLRVCIIKLEGKTHVLINPQIIKKSWRKEVGEEGCLSFPGIFVPIKRHAKVTVRTLDEKGESRTLKAKGLLARAFQHEIDHLEGITIEDRKNKKHV